MSLFWLPQTQWFSVALLLMLGIGALEVLALLFGQSMADALEQILPAPDLSPHSEVAVGEDSSLARLFSWLRYGEVPLLMLLVLWLCGFGLTGLLLQWGIFQISQTLLPGWLAVLLVLPATLPLLRLTGGWLAQLLPKDETTAVSHNDLLGRVAVITLGHARSGYSAEARVMDQHGYQHYIRVEPDDQSELQQGSAVLLLSYAHGRYLGCLAPESLSPFEHKEMKP
jgi:hypothetical protein